MSDSTKAGADRKPSWARRTGVFAAVAVTTVAACLAATRWAERALRSDPRSLPGFDLNLTSNTGAAFGLAGGLPTWMLVSVIVVVLGGVGYAAITGLLPVVPAALLFGGGLANIADRARDGVVTDYFDIGWWPVFNLADIAITSGVALLLLMTFRRSESEPDDADPQDPRTPSDLRSNP